MSETLLSVQMWRDSSDYPESRGFSFTKSPAERFAEGLAGLARVGVLGVACAAPWWLGGVEPDVQFWLYTALLISLGLWLAAIGLEWLINGISAIPLPMILAPVLGSLLLGSLQLWPTDDPSIASSSAKTPTEKSSLEHEPVRPVGAAPALMKDRPAHLSICIPATRLELSRLVMAIIALYLGAVLFAQREHQTWLWTCLALNGAALAFFGIVQQLSWNGKLFWTEELTLGGQPFASYVNRNNAAGYLCLCLAAAWGLVDWLAVGLRRRTASRPSAKAEPFQRRALSRLSALGSGKVRLNGFDVQQLVALIILAIIATGIVCSRSRGGVLAMFVAMLALFFIFFLARRSGGLRVAFVLLAIGLLSFSLLTWTGLTGAAGERWKIVTAKSLSAEGRLQNWGDALKAARDFPVTGTGFGTYRYAYLPYQTRPITVHYYNADNQFVEGLVEGGLVGLGLILLSIGLGLVACLALARAVPVDSVVAVGFFALISQCACASFDFGPTLAANMIAFALIVGAVAGRAAWQCAGRSLSHWVCLPVLRPAWMTPLLGVALLVHGGLGLKQVWAAAESRVAMRQLPRLESESAMSKSSVSESIRRLENALARNPDEPEAHRVLADLWIYRYRLEMMELLAAQDSNDAHRTDWILTDPTTLYFRIQEWTRAGDREQVDALLDIPLVRVNLVPAWLHLSAAQAACPLMPEIDAQLATLAFIESPGEPAGEAHLRRAVLISPGDADLQARCGKLAQAAGLTDFSFACWRRALELSPDQLQEMRPLWKDQLTLEQELQSILPETPEILLRLVEGSYTGDEHRAIRHDLALRAQQLLQNHNGDLDDPERLHSLARCHALLDDLDAALDEYRQLLVREPLQVKWRMEFVNLLSEKGNYQAALDQAELCKAMDPSQKKLQGQVKSLRKLILKNSISTQ